MPRQRIELRIQYKQFQVVANASRILPPRRLETYRQADSWIDLILYRKEVWQISCLNAESPWILL